MTPRLRTLAPALLLLPCLAAGSASPSAADDDGVRLAIDVRSDDGDGLHLTVGSGLVSSLVRALAPVSIDCDGDRHGADARRLAELYRALDRAGEPSRGTFEGDDETFSARRERGRLTLDIADDDGGTTRLTMPWALARCVLGGERIARGELARAIEDGSFSIDVRDEDSHVRLRFD